MEGSSSSSHRRSTVRNITPLGAELEVEPASVPQECGDKGNDVFMHEQTVCVCVCSGRAVGLWLSRAEEITATQTHSESFSVVNTGQMLISVLNDAN